MTATFPPLVESLVAAWNSHDAERILALFTDDLVYEDVTFGAVCHGREETRQFFNDAFGSFPDVRFELTAVVMDKEVGAFEWTMSGTHAGDMPGLPATGKSFRVRGASFFERAGEKLRRNRDYWDFATMLRQLGVLADPMTE